MIKVKLYGLSWCHECKYMKALLKAEDVEYEYIDAMKNPKEVEKRGINKYPVFDFIKDGKIVHTEYEAITRNDLRELLNKL